jgi:hypothetical protein
MLSWAKCAIDSHIALWYHANKGNKLPGGRYEN